MPTLLQGGLNMDDDLPEGLSRSVIGCAFTVMNTLGIGFLERVYANALTLELRRHDFLVEQEVGITVHYADKPIGHYFADLLVEKSLIVELKVVRTLEYVHRMQCMNYLKASGLRCALLLNFGNPRLEFRRILNG
jgi:GxxExxY protein